ncbi:MAG: hypothetical protein JW801_11360 [Bacteroidales bacterium]|nr:hypothetical protein [Bacteroidales bacterium]
MKPKMIVFLVLLFSLSAVYAQDKKDFEIKDKTEIKETKSKDLLNVTVMSYEIEYPGINTDTLYVAPKLDEHVYYTLDVEAMEKYYPELVIKRNDGSSVIDYNNLIPLMFDLIIRQNETIETQKEAIEQLDEQITKLESKIK